ncbi:glutathione synthase [Candidatus Vallotia tarda]|uniref:Glutathione synthetase n=1 Tax=Candidatus Vallotiella hemipterorum TaxID=1177213 RepID=A0A916JR09_9BURK|nr:glutathione synthase [Candidatus Vallotia tarda]CAG7596179.1 Glutathione synthetase [Candidatus Vallotia tarda]
MDILFITDSLSQFKIYKDTTYAIMAEVARRSYVLYTCEPRHLAYTGGSVEARVQRFSIVGDYTNLGQWYNLEHSENRSLSTFSAVLMRKDPPFDMEYITSTWLLEIAERQGARVFNKPRAIRDHSEKIAISEFAQFAAPTLVTCDTARLRAFHSEYRDVIFKPLDGMGGRGIFRIREDYMNLGSTIEMLSSNGSRNVMAQQYIPEIKDGDKRILLIGGKPVPYSLARIPQGTEIRGNIAAGGVGYGQLLGLRDLEIAAALGPVLADRGLLLVGLDVIGYWLTEINVTSPTCFREITKQTGFDIAAIFVNALEHEIS